MIKDEIAQEIEEKYQRDDYFIVKITFLDGRLIYGAFERFRDYEQLRAAYQFRFVPSASRKEFNRAFRKNDDFDPAQSIIIDCNDIATVEFL